MFFLLYIYIYIYIYSYLYVYIKKYYTAFFKHSTNCEREDVLRLFLRAVYVLGKGTFRKSTVPLFRRNQLQ